MKRAIFLVSIMLLAACGSMEMAEGCEQERTVCVLEAIQHCAAPEFGEDCIALSVQGCDEAHRMCLTNERN